MMELECKFVIPPFAPVRKTTRRALGSLASAGFCIKETSTRDHQDRYFDTSDRRLENAGWAYRIRQWKDSAQATLKQRSNFSNQPFRREELSSPLSISPNHDWTTAIGPIRERLLEIAPAKSRLQIQFDQLVRRKTYRLTRPDHSASEILLAIDQVKVVGASLRYHEIELEHVAGPENVVETTHELLSQLPHLVAANMSKQDRAIFALDPSPCYGGGTQCETWHQLAVANVERYLSRAFFYAPFAAEGIHPEGVHQARVACRRLMSALQLFEDSLPRAEQKALHIGCRAFARQLGLARDLDVQLKDLNTYESSRRFRSQLERERAVAQESLTLYLRTDALARLRRSLTRLTSVAHDTASEEVNISQGIEKNIPKRLNDLRRLGQFVIMASDKNRLHQLRLAVKQTLYQLECLPEPPQKLARRVRKLQEILGRHQDASVALARSRAMKNSARMARTRKRYRGRIRQARKEFRVAWAKYVHTLPGSQNI